MDAFISNPMIFMLHVQYKTIFHSYFKSNKHIVLLFNLQSFAEMPAIIHFV